MIFPVGNLQLSDGKLQLTAPTFQCASPLIRVRPTSTRMRRHAVTESNILCNLTNLQREKVNNKRELAI